LFQIVVKQALFASVNHGTNQYCSMSSRKQREPLMGFKLTTDKNTTYYESVTTRYPSKRLLR